MKRKTLVAFACCVGVLPCAHAQDQAAEIQELKQQVQALTETVRTLQQQVQAQQLEWRRGSSKRRKLSYQ